jgi:hypothetical protein
LLFLGAIVAPGHVEAVVVDDDQALETLGGVDGHGVDKGNAHPGGHIPLPHVLVKEQLNGLPLPERQDSGFLAQLVQPEQVMEVVHRPVRAGDGVGTLCLEEGLESLEMPEQLSKGAMVYRRLLGQGILRGVKRGEGRRVYGAIIGYEIAP